RGPAPEAQTLYEDLSPPEPRPDPTPETQQAPKYEGKGRPTKRDRRKMAAERRDSLE
ncbi:MAG: RNA-binding S4 domain-containing protein, partial [Pseudomonadota bacterium]